MSFLLKPRVLSGMRPTGALHIGHYHGVLKNWLVLQQQYDCFFFVADWHALTTHYADTSQIKQQRRDMLIDWLAVGIDPARATLFFQSHVLAHAELHLLLSMTTPLSWLERVPTYKDQQEKLKDKDLTTYGFLGYPLLQSADILIYRASLVPVGEDQVPHVEMTREIARRFNHMYGADDGFVEAAEQALKKLTPVQRSAYYSARKSFLQDGKEEALQAVRKDLQPQSTLGISTADYELLYAYLEGEHRMILPPPAALLTAEAKLPGLDGQKMSKSYGNTIGLRDTPELVNKKIKQMATDPARVRRHDKGDPNRCPVWSYHRIYSDAETCDWVMEGCKSAGIGCLECKAPLIDAILAEQVPIQERAQYYISQPQVVDEIAAAGATRARQHAEETMQQVRAAMGL